MLTEAGSSTSVLYGAYWSTEAENDTLLMVNNPNLEEQTLRLVLFSHTGRQVADTSLSLGSTESLSVSLRDLLGHNDWGHLELDFPGRLKMLPAQALVSNGTDAWIVDLHSSRELAYNSRNRFALLPDLGHSGPLSAGVKTFVTLTNSGEKPLSGRVLVQAQQEEHIVSWRLPAFGSRRLRLGPWRGLAGLEVRPEQSDPHLMVDGWTGLSGGRMLPLDFQGGVLEQSGEQEGFFFSGRSQLLLWNLSGDAVEATIRAATSQGDEGNNRGLTLKAGETRSLELHEFLGLAPDAAGAVTVFSPPGAHLIARTAGFGPDPSVAVLQDVRYETNIGYSLAVRLAPDLATKLRIYNPNDQKVDMCLFLLFGEKRITYPLKHLEGHEFVEVDLLRAQAEGTSGEMGSSIPQGPLSGQAKIVIHAPDGMKNLVVMGMYEDPASGINATLQGCFVCPSPAYFIRIDPSPIDGIVGDSATYHVIVTFEDLTSKDVTISPDTSVFVDDFSIATAILGRVDFASPGSTTLHATFMGCISYSVQLGEIGRCPCLCEAKQPLTDSAPVKSRDLHHFNVEVTSSPVPGETNSLISGTPGNVKVTAIDNFGDVFKAYRGTVGLTSTDSTAQFPPSYTYTSTDSGAHTFSCTLSTVSGTSPTRDLTVKDSTKGKSGTDNIFLWFHVVATREGLVGNTTACNHTIVANDHFVALPSTGLCGTSVKLRNGSMTQTTTVQDVGPWFPHSTATTGNPCVGPDDPYWNTSGVPRTESSTCDSNDAGIDLADGTFNDLGLSGNIRILWRFGN